MIDETSFRNQVVAAGTTASNASELAGLQQRMNHRKKIIEQQLSRKGPVNNLKSMGEIKAPKTDRFLFSLAQRAEQFLAGTLDPELIPVTKTVLEKKSQEAITAGNIPLAKKYQNLLDIFNNPAKYKGQWQAQQA